MRTSLVAVLSALLPLGASAEEAAPFLKLGGGARALAMGGAYTAAADDVDAVVWNPAGLAALPSRQFGFTRVAMTERTNYDFIGFAQPTRLGTVAAAGRHLGQGKLEGRDAAGRPSGGFSASDTAVDLAYGVSVSTDLKVGASARYVMSSIAEAKARGAAFDLGGQYKLGSLGPGIAQAGLAALNMGSRMKFAGESAPLPLVLAGGLSWRTLEGPLLALDYRHRPYAASSDIGAGAEWKHRFSPDLGGALRAGADSSRRDLGGLAVMSLGAGLRWSAVEASFAWRPGGDLGDSFVYSLLARF